MIDQTQEAESSAEISTTNAAQPSSTEAIYAAVMHFSQLGIYLIPVAAIGFIVPTLLWALKRKDSAFIDNHGINILNWLLTMAVLFATSCFGYALITLLSQRLPRRNTQIAEYLLNYLMHLPNLMLIVSIFSIVQIFFCLIGAAYAAKGEERKYPLTYKFIK